MHQSLNPRNIYPIIDQAQEGLSEWFGGNFAMDFGSTVLAQRFRKLQSEHILREKYIQSESKVEHWHFCEQIVLSLRQ